MNITMILGDYTLLSTPQLEAMCKVMVSPTGIELLI